MRGRTNPALITLAHLTLPGLVAIAAVALGAYATGYRRHFLRIAELSEAMSAAMRSPVSQIYRYLDRLILHSAFQRAGFRFLCKTLVRSEAHRLLLTGVGGLGVVLASQELMSAVEVTRSARQAAVSIEVLSIPFILSFLIIIGLRTLFEIPAELPSNWIFRLMLDPEHQECESLARKIILVAIFPWVILVIFPLYVRFAGLWIALLHTLLVLGASSLLTNGRVAASRSRTSEPASARARHVVHPTPPRQDRHCRGKTTAVRGCFEQYL